MELITILNRCHRFRGFVYERARPLQCGQKEHPSSRATAKGLDRSLLTLPFAGARLQPTRRTALRVHSPVGGVSSFAIFAVRRAALYAVAKRLSADTPASDASAKSRTMTARSFSSSFFDVLCR